jgi:TPR repeat protein
MLQVGTSLLNGTKVPIDRSEAEKWLRRAYEAGDEGAMLILANEYLHQKRFKDGEALLKGYPENDYPPALYLMGYINLGLGNKAKAREMFERASALGHRRAKWSLSRLCTLGRFGIRSIPYGLRLGNEIGDEVRKGELEATSRPEAAQNVVAAPAPVS